MVTIDEIRDFKTDMISKRHNQRVKEQNTDLGFFNDDYPLPLVKDKDYALRTGYVSGMVNGVTGQIISDNPRVFTKSRKETSTLQEASNRIASEMNRWAKYLQGYSINPYSESFKNKNIYGENWIYVVHNRQLALWDEKVSWQEALPDAVPIHFILYDPTVVFSDPSEDIGGKPKRVVVSYKRTIGDILASYPKWTKRENRPFHEEVEFLFYVDKEAMYAEADMEPLFRDIKGEYASGIGVRQNPYGLVPFTHTYSGWGKETADRKPELLAFGRVRMMRDMIVEDSTMRSNFSYNFTKFAHRAKTLINRTGQPVGADAFKEYQDMPDAISEIVLPPGEADFTVDESQLFEAPVFAYADRLRADLAMEYPMPLRGVATGTSGRQEDILRGSGLVLYNAPLLNTEREWAEAFDIGMQICYKLPGMKPPKLQEDDIRSYSEVTVKIRREDPTELSRKAADGDRAYQNGIIDHETNLVENRGKTKEEARLIKSRLLADDVERNDPTLRMLIARQMAQEIGLEDEYEALKAEMAEREKGINASPEQGSRGGEPREGKIETELGGEMSDMSLERRPTRLSPER